MVKWLAVIVALSASMANAEDPPTHVQIGFVFDAPELTRLWQPGEIAAHQTELALYIDETLSGDSGPLREWSISTESSENQVVLVVRLIGVSHGLGFELDVSGDRGELLAAAMNEPWLTAGEFFEKIPYPHDEALSDIKDALDDLLTRNRTSLDSYLRDVVALTNDQGHFVNNAETGELELILPLDWNSYKRLRNAKFVVKCEKLGVGEVQVVANGRGRRETVQGPPSYDAIVTKPVQSISDGISTNIVNAQHWPEVQQLKVGPVFLSRSESVVDGFRSADP